MRQGERDFCLGEDMYVAHKAGGEMPLAADIDDKDSADIKRIKSVINRMTTYESAERPSAEGVIGLILTSYQQVMCKPWLMSCDVCAGAMTKYSCVLSCKQYLLLCTCDTNNIMYTAALACSVM